MATTTPEELHKDEVCWVQLGEHRIEGTESEVRDLFLIGCFALKRGRAIATSPDTTVFLSPGSQLSIYIPDGFTAEFDPAGEIQRELSKSSRQWATL